MMNRISRAVRILSVLLFSAMAMAASAGKIDRDVDKALDDFKEQVDGADIFLEQGAGYLVFPRVVKAGIGIGIETGEGALHIDGKTEDYYRTSSGSVGLQLGVQSKSIVVVFMTLKSLQSFRDSEGWTAGVDGSVVLVDTAHSKDVDSSNIKDPIVAFVFGSKGLMYNLTLEGSKFSKLDK